MKKILAILLALCLVLSLSMSVIADDAAAEPEDPEVVEGADDATTEPEEEENNSIVTDPGEDEGDKTVGHVYDSEGNLLGDVIVEHVDVEGDIYAEVLEYGDGDVEYDVIGVYVVTFIGTAVDDVTGDITFDVYAPGVTEDSIVLVRDDWEEGLAELVEVNGDRAKVTVDADLMKEYEYFAIVNVVTDNGEDNNPPMGIALAVVPMMVAAAAIVISKKR